MDEDRQRVVQETQSFSLEEVAFNYRLNIFCSCVLRHIDAFNLILWILIDSHIRN